MKLKTSEEVAHALSTKGPIVALESTLLAHGLPAPRRALAAATIESAVRRAGATPATIAIIGGTVHLGLEPETLETIISGRAKKAALRDLAVALAGSGDWATTVSTTMALASRAGISVFATGGIGGVHREVLDTFDESSDLTALARYPVTVVCAGAKSVLDLPRTLERLETLGVPVLGYRTDELPAFYHARSGLKLPHRVESAEDIAAIMEQRFTVLGEGGILVAQPPPASLAQDPAVADALIERALAEAKAEGVRGTAITPFLLAWLDRSSSGSVVDTNLALVIENARLAAEIAVAASARAAR